jgi:hypothetical protein
VRPRKLCEVSRGTHFQKLFFVTPATDFLQSSAFSHTLALRGGLRLIACRMVRNNRKGRASVSGFNRPIVYPKLRY